MYKSPWCFLSSFKSTDLLVQEKKRQIDFQYSHRGGHLGFRIETVLAIFDLQVTPMLATKFQVNSPFGSGEEAKNRFSRWRPIGTILAIFHLQGVPMLPTELQINWPFGSGEEANIRFSRFPISTNLAMFDLQVTTMLLTKFQDNWPFGSRRPVWISDQNNLNYLFYLQVILMLHTKFQVSWPFSSGEETKQLAFQDGGHGGHLGFPIGTIIAKFDRQDTPMLPTSFWFRRRSEK